MTFTVFTAEFQHESNTFSRRPAALSDFTGSYFYRGEEAIRERGAANTPLGGFLEVGQAQGWRMIHALSTAATPSGAVTRDAYEAITGEIIASLRAAMPDIHGILLGLHGAMVAEHVEDGEGELLERIRAIVGAEMPVGITLDPHANVTDRMARLANIIVAYKTYPHVDIRECAVQAATVLHSAMRGDIRPFTLREAPPMLEETTGGRTDIGPMVPRIAQARAYEQQPDVFAVSVNGGFGNADIAEVGPSVLVTCQGDPAPHRAFIRQVARDIWARRDEVVNHYFTPEEAAAIGRDFDAATGPLVIADYADNPGGGAYGDSTALLAAMIEARLENACFGPVFDPEAVRHLARHQPGDRVSLPLGGKTDPGFGGGPIAFEGVLTSLHDGHFVGSGPMIGGLKGSFGSTAVIRTGGIDILVISNVLQILDLEQFRAFGIEPTRRKVVALKSMQHFRAAFEPVAGRVIVCDSGALCTPDLTKLPFSRVRRPVYPLDASARYEA